MDRSTMERKASLRSRLSIPYPKNLLTVLCYHRIQRDNDSRFQGYKPNISASQKNFIRQINYLRTHYNPIALRDLVRWLHYDEPLPPRPVLVTFDDGYRDNVDVAWPVMRERGIPAIVFLATDYIGATEPFICDLVAYCFGATAKRNVDVPLIGSINISSGAKRDTATIAWVNALKRIPGLRRADAVDQLISALGVERPSRETFRHLYLDWDDVRKFTQEGVEFGAHTRSHPILAKLPLDQAITEISSSIRQVAEVLGYPPLGFAYPNGSAGDYSKEHEKAVQQSGVPTAFNLEPGPVCLSDVRERPTGIRRIYVGQQDDLLRFVAKLHGAARLANMLR